MRLRDQRCGRQKQLLRTRRHTTATVDHQAARRQRRLPLRYNASTGAIIQSAPDMCGPDAQWLRPSSSGVHVGQQARDGIAQRDRVAGGDESVCPFSLTHPLPVPRSVLITGLPQAMPPPTSLPCW
jgi:hypothetical protein